MYSMAENLKVLCTHQCSNHNIYNNWRFSELIVLQYVITIKGILSHIYIILNIKENLQSFKITNLDIVSVRYFENIFH